MTQTKLQIIVNKLLLLQFGQSMSSKPLQRTTQPPYFVRSSIDSLVRTVRRRHSNRRRQDSQIRSSTSGRSSALLSWYQQAKNAETIQRDLRKALQLYLRSAQQGDRIDSCIKDFASILHQMGYTKEAVRLLNDLREFYLGDLNKYDRLTTTLQRQLVPSVKHQCKIFLFELPNRQKVSTQLIESLFENTSRIKRITLLNHLALGEQPESEGKWLFIQFDSFSAAKKTLQKFRFSQWFGINKYWVKGKLIACQASDGRDDFQNRLVVTDQLVRENLLLYWSQEQRILWTEAQKVHYENECAIKLIHNSIAEKIIDLPDL